MYLGISTGYSIQWSWAQRCPGDSGMHSYRPSKMDPKVLRVQEGAPVDQVC